MGRLKLTTRVLIFFLVAIAILLVAYSLTIYTVERQHVHYRFNEELRTSLNSLAAAIEVEDTEVKWQPLEHTVSVGDSSEFGNIEWVVVGDNRSIVDGSHQRSDYDATAITIAAKTQTNGIAESAVEGERKYFYERLTAPHPAHHDREPDEFDEVVVIVSRSTAMRDASLARLAFLVTILPAIVWLAAAIPGYWFVRSAMRPVFEMAEQAEQIAGADFSSRLSINHSGDELVELAKVFNRVLDRQQIVIEQQRRFADDAAHELRTPLTALIGQIEVALRRPRSVEEYRDLITNLKVQASSLHEIVELLLFLARSEPDSTALGLRKIYVSAWLNEHQRSWTAWPRGRDIVVINTIASDAAINATPSLMARLLDNVVSNACKYSSERTPISVEAELQGNTVTLKISDSGAGISAEDLDHLFEPFFRTTAARLSGRPGNGLGLAITHRIAQLLGGAIGCESQLGSGTCFTIQLPLCPTT